ncbi:MAG TPA: metallophosphoesterase [Rhizomicrobium sp.]|jgi:predicted phosphodiesterase|nr:metallophosphoesterase [Rhizomicrobium sp.]
MKIAVMSDLHLEYDARYLKNTDSSAQDRTTSRFYSEPPQPEADFLVLAGDIHSGPLAFDWTRRHFSIPTILIGGNHEAYDRELFRAIAFNRHKTETSDGPVVFLERATWEGALTRGERVRFIGATLWTDFQLYGTPARSMAIALEQLDDFKLIKFERGYRLRTLRPSDTARLHHTSVDFLHEELKRPFDGITVVVTHHAPSQRSISARFKNHPLNPAFASDLDGLIQTYKPSLWIHGHMHESFDYVIGRTRVVCNPRGYFPDQLNPEFDPHFVVEIK